MALTPGELLDWAAKQYAKGEYPPGWPIERRIMEHQGQTNEIAAALAKAQAEMKPAKKDSTNPFFKSKYASLDSVWESMRDSFSKNGLSILQPCKIVGRTISVRTWLYHTSGQRLYCGEVTVEAADSKPQSIGSGLSYCRRYGLGPLGVVSEEDDDAESGMGRGPQQTRPVNPQTTPKNLIVPAKNVSDKAISALQEYAKEPRQSKLQAARLGAVRALKTTTDAQEMAKSIAQWRTNAKLTDDEYNELMAEMEKVTEDKDVPF